jgi:hypothetical protein
VIFKVNSKVVLTLFTEKELSLQMLAIDEKKVKKQGLPNVNGVR